MVFVIEDRFHEMYQCVSCRSSHDASQIANLFFKEVVRIHGFPLSIVTDMDTKFVGHFWRTLWKKLGNSPFL